jgi:hypothetical protein
MLNHVLHQQVRSALAEIPEMFGGWHRVAVSAVVVSVDCETGGYQKFDHAGVPRDMLTHPVGNLDHTAHGPTHNRFYFFLLRTTMQIPSQVDRPIPFGGELFIATIPRLLESSWN